MFSFLFVMTALGNPGELTFALQRYGALAGRKLLVVASGPQALDLANKCKKIDPLLNYYIHPVGQYSDIRREIKKAQTTFAAKCALHLSIENRTWKLRPYGKCFDPDRSLSLKEDDNSWRVIDNRDRPVRAIDYAVLTKDQDLLKVLKNEERKSYDLSQRLFIGGAVVASSALIPMIFGKNEEIAQLEDRRWTALFLLGSGYMLYEASKKPPLMKRDKTLSNYRPKSMIVDKLNETWPPPPKEDPEETTEENIEDSPKESSEDSPAEGTETQSPQEDLVEPLEDTPNTAGTTPEQETVPQDPTPQEPPTKEDPKPPTKKEGDQ